MSSRKQPALAGQSTTLKSNRSFLRRPSLSLSETLTETRSSTESTSAIKPLSSPLTSESSRRMQKILERLSGLKRNLIEVRTKKAQKLLEELPVVRETDAISVDPTPKTEAELSLGQFRQLSIFNPNYSYLPVEACSKPVAETKPPAFYPCEVLLSSIAPAQSQPRKFSELPMEVLLMIMEYLPTSYAAALVLCCRTFYERLGNEKFIQINRGVTEPYTEWFSRYNRGTGQNPEEIERQIFLELLDRDSDKLIYCYFCKKLHTPELTNSWAEGPYVYASKRRPCARVQAYQRPESYMDEFFNFSQVQRVMKHHRMGKDTFAFLQAMARMNTVQKPEHSYQRSTQFRISLKGHFLARTQHKITLWGNAKQPPRFPDFCRIELCPHLSGYDSQTHPTVLDIQIRCKMSHPQTPECNFCAAKKSCHSCDTEYQLHSIQINHNTWALCYTVWQDFGKGRNPFEEKWENLALGSSSCKVTESTYKKRNIKKRFEESKFDDSPSEQSLITFESK